MDEGWATLRTNDGELRIRWDVEQLPQVAFWLNAGAWAADGGAPYYNLGLEPCIGAQDALWEAVERFGQYAVLPAHGTRRWSLDVYWAANHAETWPAAARLKCNRPSHGHAFEALRLC